MDLLGPGPGVCAPLLKAAWSVGKRTQARESRPTREVIGHVSPAVWPGWGSGIGRCPVLWLWGLSCSAAQTQSPRRFVALLLFFIIIGV